jgi:hypothetical protein
MIRTAAGIIKTANKVTNLTLPTNLPLSFIEIIIPSLCRVLGRSIRRFARVNDNFTMQQPLLLTGFHCWLKSKIHSVPVGSEALF